MQKLIIIILVSVCMFGSLQAQSPIGRDLASLRRGCYYQLPGCTTSTSIISTSVVDFAINRAIAETCKKYPAIEKLDTIGVSKDDEGVALNSDFLRIKKVFRMGSDTLRYPLAPIPTDSVFSFQGDLKNHYHEDKNSLLSIKYFSTFGKRLLLHPKPAKLNADPDSFLVYYFAQDAMLVNSTDSTAVSSDYTEKVILYACAVLSATRRDYQAAAFYMNMFEPKIPPVQSREMEMKK